MRVANLYLTLNFFFLLFLFARLVFGAENAGLSSEKAAQFDRLDKVRVELETKIAETERRIDLGRSLGEFIDEVSLFDNQLYGRLGSGSSEQRRTEVLNTIAETNAQIDKILSSNKEGTIPPGDGMTTGDIIDRGDAQMIQELREEVANLNAELKLLEIPLIAGTDVMSTDIWNIDDELTENINPVSLDGQDIIDNLKDKLAEIKQMQESIKDSGNKQTPIRQ